MDSKFLNKTPPDHCSNPKLHSEDLDILIIDITSSIVIIDPNTVYSVVNLVSIVYSVVNLLYSVVSIVSIVYSEGHQGAPEGLVEDSGQSH